MTYYKVIKDGEIIDVNHIFLKWQQKHNLLLSCDVSEALFIQSSDGTQIWRVDWLNRIPQECNYSFESIEAVEITKEEYESLKKQLDLGDTVPDTDGTETPDGETDTPEENPPQEEVLSATALRLRVQELTETVADLAEQNKTLVEQNTALADELQATKIILGVE